MTSIMLKHSPFKILSIIASAAFLLPLLVSCALFDRDKSILSPVMWGEIDRNRENLKKLRVGMTRDEVLKVMGEPMKDQVYCTSKHWFYYTRTRWSDGMATRDECTPLVFSDEGLLTGWGLEYYKANYSIAVWSDKEIKADLE